MIFALKQRKAKLVMILSNVLSKHWKKLDFVIHFEQSCYVKFLHDHFINSERLDKFNQV